jgi:hypothetical protein
MSSSYQLGLWKQESFLVLGELLEDHGFGDVLYLSAMML